MTIKSGMLQKPIVFFIPLLTAIISLSLFFVALVNGWFGIAEGVGSNFCEASRAGLIKQPANTWSNMGFITAGLVMAYELASGKHYRNANPITRSTFYGIFLCCMAILLGPGSMAMHATTTKVGGFLDVLSMFMISSFMVAYAIERFFKLNSTWFTIIFILALAIGIWSMEQDYKIVFDHFGSAMFAFSLTLAGAFEGLNIFIRKKKHTGAWAYVSLATIFLSTVIWNLSHTDAILCDPSSLIQGHAAWHLLDAFALYCLYRYYVSEHDTTRKH